MTISDPVLKRNDIIFTPEKIFTQIDSKMMKMRSEEYTASKEDMRNS
jgi:hypothetical protein